MIFISIIRKVGAGFFPALFLTIIISLNLSQNAFAITLEEAIDLATQKSTQIQIEEQKAKLTALSKADATTMFLPNISASYQKGNRTTSISESENKLKEDTRSIELRQPIFNGFQSISRVKEAISKTNAAKEDLKARKNDVALAVAQSYINILKLRKVLEIENQQITDYKQLLALAKQRLSLNDIAYSEYNDYETRNQNLILEAQKNKSNLVEYELTFENLVKQKADNLIKPILNLNLTNLDEVLNSATSNNPKIKSSSNNLKAANSAAFAEKGRILPKASLLLKRENQKSSYYFGGSTVNNDIIYLDVTIPIFQSGTEYSAIAKANKEKKIAQLENKLAFEEVEKQVKEEYGKFNSLRESLVAFEEVSKNALESLKLTQDRFQKKDIGQMEFLLKKVDVVEVAKQTLIIECDMLNSYFVLEAITNDITNL